MHDFDYDVLQKKRIARGAYHKRGGSKSHRCTLPSDFLSAAELKRRNGPMTEYRMNEPMNWSAFRSMPDDLQVQYVTGLRAKYGATDAMFADMFCVHPATFSAVRAKLGIPGKLPRTGADQINAREALWQEFRNRTVEATPDGDHAVHEEQDLTCDKPVTLDPLETVTPVEIAADTRVTEIDMTAVAESLYTPDALRLADLTATFRGEFDPVKFMLWVSKLPMPDGNVKIRIEVTEA